MELFYQIVGGVLITLVLAMTLRRQGQDITLLLGLCGCCMVLLVLGRYLEPVLDFLEQLQDLSGLDANLLSVILKAVGIALVAEIAMLICADSGNAALGKTLQILSTGVILWLSLPLMKSLLTLVERIVGGT